MTPKKRYKIVVIVPESHADELRKAIGDAGAGKIGNYTHCTFTTKGETRFIPGPDSDPVDGEIGKMEVNTEYKIETVCEEDKLKAVLKAIKDTHPYEEPATDVYPIEVFE